MGIVELLVRYIGWHYSRGISDLVHIAGNFFWFVGNAFSVRTLITTLVQPFKRIEEEHVGFIKDPALFFQNLLVNTIMRIVGLIVRLMMLAVALMLSILVLFLTVMCFVAWIAFPLLVVFLITTGISYLLN